MKINPKIGRSPADLQGLKFSDMKKYIKHDLKRLEKNTSKDSPTLFMMIGNYDYPDKKKVALPIIGRRSIDWKKHAKDIVAKDDTGVLGRVYFSGINADGQKVIVMDVAKGKGKTKITKLDKGLKKLVPQSTFQVIFNQIQESELDELENQFDSAGDVAEIEVPEGADDDGEVEVDANQSYTQLLASNLAKLSAQFVPIRDNMKAKVNNDPEDIELLLDYAVEWLELYAEADPAAQTAVAAKVSQVEAIKAFAEGQVGESSATARQKTDTVNAADKALAVGLEMAKAPSQVMITPAAGVAAIPAAKLAVLKEILAKAGETKATITSYSRTAEEQARIMYNNIIKDGEAKNKASYKNPAAAATVVDAFMAALKAGKNGQEIYAAVLSAVKKAGAANLSDHCGSNPAIDIDPASLKDAAKFEAALKADSRVKAVTPPNDPLYHLIIT